MRQCVVCKKPLGDWEFGGLCKRCSNRDRMTRAMAMVKSWRFNLQMSKECGDTTMIEQCEAELAEAKEHVAQVRRETA